MEIERYGRYRATLRIRRDPRFGSVRPEVERLDGTRFETRELWPINCSDDEFANKAYDGEHAMDTPRDWPIHWVASGDLIDLERMSG